MSGAGAARPRGPIFDRKGGCEWEGAEMEVAEGSRWIDLTLLLAEDLPTWPAHMYFQRKVWNWFNAPWNSAFSWRHESAYYTAWWTIDEHAGTHFDAPAHFVPPIVGKDGSEENSDTGEARFDGAVSWTCKSHQRAVFVRSG